MTTRAASHPEHSRGSCSDEHVTNADASGSAGCARCTALLLDQRDRLASCLASRIDEVNRLRKAAARLNEAMVKCTVTGHGPEFVTAVTAWRREWLQVDGHELPVGDKVLPAPPIRNAHAYQRRGR